MEETANKKIYELGYHAMPNLSEEELAKFVEGIKGTLSKMGASVIADQYPVAMALSYDVVKEIENKNRKFRNSFFGWMKFDLDPALLEEFKATVDKNLSILRYILIRTVRESTLATPKLATRGMPRRSAPESETIAPMDEVAVDKKIDEMIEADVAALDLPETK